MKYQIINDKCQINHKAQMPNLKTFDFSHLEFICNLGFGICNLSGAQNGC